VDNQSLSNLDFAPFVKSVIHSYELQRIAITEEYLIETYNLWTQKVLSNSNTYHFSNLSIGTEIVAILFWETLSPDQIYIAQFVVHYHWRSIGIGKFMMKKFYEMNPNTKIFIGLVRKGNSVAINFYKALGAKECDFEYLGYTKEYQGFSLQRIIDP